MTIFGWDTSHYDGVLTRDTLARARAEGIDFFTHKIGEGTTNDDPLDGTVLAAARDAGIPLLGGYYVPHQHLDAGAEVRRCIALADRDEPWWRDFPGWFWQWDAERWSGTDRTTPAEIRAACDLLAKLTNRVVVCYASRGQYGNDLTGLHHPLWNAAYASRRAGSFRSLYPGDSAAGWAPYSGQTPILLQYTSSATIAGVTTCDANAFRGSLAELRALVAPHTVTEEARRCARPDPVVPIIKKETDLLRFVFDPTAGGNDQHVYITDGVRYRIQPLSSAVNNLLTSAGAPPIYHVTGVVPGWTLEATIAALCGSPDPGEYTEPTP